MIFDSVIAGRYADWRGLPDGMTQDLLEEELGEVVRRAGPVERDRTFRRYTVTSFERASEPRKVDAWFPVGDPHAFLLEFRVSGHPGLEAELDAMGEPSLLLEDRMTSATHMADEWVYPDRGIALLAGRPFTPKRPGVPLVLLRVRLFRPMTPERYLTEVDDDTGLRPKTHPAGA